MPLDARCFLSRCRIETHEVRIEACEQRRVQSLPSSTGRITPSGRATFSTGYSPNPPKSHNLDKRKKGAISRGVGSTQLLCLVRKLTSVGYLKKPVYCSNAKHRLFSYFPAIFRVSITLQRLDSRPRLSPKQPLSGGQSETNTLGVSGL